MKPLIDDGLVNPASLGFNEDEVNNTMGAGQAAMALNWTYGKAVMNDPKAVEGRRAGRRGRQPGPREHRDQRRQRRHEHRRHPELKHPDAALEYALSMASQKSQEMDTSLAFPMWKSSFDNPELTKADPYYWAAANTQFAGLVARPVVPYYTKLSNALQVAIQEALQGKKTPEDALNGVAAQLPDLQK